MYSLSQDFYDTTDGEVIVGDRNVKEYDIESLRDEVAMVLQKNVLFSEQSKKTCVGVMTTQQMKKSKEYVSLHKPMNLFRHSPISMIHYIEQGGSNVSGGQKQKTLYRKSFC